MQDSTFSAFTSELREKNNIVDVVRNYVELDQRGSNFWAKCPIHGEKTPSFSVNELKGSYHCFGCGAHGDVFSFVMTMEHCTFMEAVKFLADRVGLELPKFERDGKEEERRLKKDKLYNLMREAALHYFGNIKLAEGKPAFDYALKRGLAKVVLNNFGVGVSIGYNSLINHLISKGYTRDEMLESGVAEEKNGKIFDALANRLIIPIFNNLNKVIAFGGRALEITDFAKYKNTKETLIFEKRKELFGLHTLKKVKTKANLDFVIIVEGYMDVISLYQAGICNVCASMGTALTIEQAKLLKYYSNNIYLCYDGDKAGQKATYRGIDILREAGLNIKVVTLVEGLDPDDIIKQYGINFFDDLINKASPPTEYKLSSIAKTYNLSEPSEQGKFAIEAIKILSELPTIVEREAYIPLLKKMSGISQESLLRQLNTDGTPEYKVVKINPKVYVRDKKSSLVIKYYHSARFILLSIFKNILPAQTIEDITPYLDDDEHIKIYDYIRLLKSQNNHFTLENLKDLEGNMEAEKIYNSGFKNMNEQASLKMFDECLHSLKISALKLQLEDLIKAHDLEENLTKKAEIKETIGQINKKITEFK